LRLVDVALIASAASARLDSIGSAGWLPLAPLCRSLPQPTQPADSSSPISQIRSARTTRIAPPPLSSTPLPSPPSPPLNPRSADRRAACAAAAVAMQSEADPEAVGQSLPMRWVAGCASRDLLEVSHDGSTSALLSRPGRITSARLWADTAGAVPPALASRIRFSLRLQFHSRHTSAMLCLARRPSKQSIFYWSDGAIAGGQGEEIKGARWDQTSRNPEIEVRRTDTCTGASSFAPFSVSMLNHSCMPPGAALAPDRSDWDAILAGQRRCRCTSAHARRVAAGLGRLERHEWAESENEADCMMRETSKKRATKRAEAAHAAEDAGASASKAKKNREQERMGGVRARSHGALRRSRAMMLTS